MIVKNDARQQGLLQPASQNRVSSFFDNAVKNSPCWKFNLTISAVVPKMSVISKPSNPQAAPLPSVNDPFLPRSGRDQNGRASNQKRRQKDC